MRLALIKSLIFFITFVFTGISFTAISQEQENDSIPQVGLPEVVISALRLPFKASTVPYSVSLMNSRTNTPGLSLSENLAGLPGLEVNARYNFAVGDRITNRGFGARTQFGVRGIRIVFDDMPVTFADGQTNLEMIDLQNLSYVEHLRGPGSSLYGNASGGVLILHSKDIGNYRFMSGVSSAIGSDGLFRWNIMAEGRTGKTKISGNYTDFRYSGFRDHANADYKRIFIKSVSDFSSKDNLQLEGGYVDFNALNPGSLTKQEASGEPGKANPASVSNAAGQDGKQAQISGKWRHQADTGSMLKITVYGIHRSIVNPIIGKIIELPQYSGGIVASYNSKIRLGYRTAEWSAGTEIAGRFNNRKNFENNGGEEGNITISQTEQVIGTGFFVQALFPVTPKLNIDGCLRYDLSYFGVQNHLDSLAGENGSRIMKALNPSIGIIYRLYADFRLFANLSTSFETPTSTELVNRPEGAGGFNPDLNPARAIEYETGFRGSFYQMLRYDLAAFLIITKNELIPFQVPSSPGQDYYRNAGSTIHRGGEVTLRFAPDSFIDLTASLTYIDAYYNKFTVKGSDFSENKIPGISQIHSATELKLHNNKGFYFSFLVQSSGKMYADDANSEFASQHTIYDLGLGHDGFRFGKRQIKTISVSGGISNLFDKKYITSVSVNAAAGRFYEPGPGRTFYLNIRFNFGVQ